MSTITIYNYAQHHPLLSQPHTYPTKFVNYTHVNEPKHQHSRTTTVAVLAAAAAVAPSPSPLLSSSSSSSSSDTTTNNLTLPSISSSSSSETWPHTILSQARSNLFHDAISTYISTLITLSPLHLHPDAISISFPALLKAVSGIHDLRLGKQLHAHFLKFGSPVSVTVANTLLHMYATCASDLEHVFKVFHSIPPHLRDQVSWNSLISALSSFQEWDLALQVFRSMLSQHLQPTSYTLVAFALVCSHLGNYKGVHFSMQLHAYCLRRQAVWTTFTNNALMSMYSKLGRLQHSLNLFALFEDPNLVSWNTIISSLSQAERFLEALAFLRLMLLQRVKPDGFTFASALPGCSELHLLGCGRQIHAYALKNGDLDHNSFVGSALVDMYCSCGKVEIGRSVFDGILDKGIGLWNAMIAGYAQKEYDDAALALFVQMQVVAGLCPNATTMASVLPAYARCETAPNKDGMHGYVIKLGLERDSYVQNALMDMYLRTGKIEISRTMFEGMDVRDIVSWNTMINGYVICGHSDDSLLLLQRMMQQLELGKRKQSSNKIGTEGQDKQARIFNKPNSITLLSILPGCASLAALAKGKEIHAYATRNLLAVDVAVGSALIDMYAKSGCLNLSRRVFDQMPMKNTITWNAMIMAYGMHGRGAEALELFKDMVADGVKPKDVTFITAFAACSHSKMVDEGLSLFHRMKEHYGIEPASDHYACIVDLLGRAGKVEEAYGIISVMPWGLDRVAAWSSLLGACRVHRNVHIGEIAAENLIDLQPNVASHYVLLSNIYSSCGLWDKAMNIRRKMKGIGVKKEPGCSWIENGDQVHKFMVGDLSHPQSEKLHHYLEVLSQRMKKEGYVPDTSCVLHNIDEDEKETLLVVHSEKLAIAFGILNTPPGTTIRIAKNLRICNDCHTATKYISKIVDREIIIRDMRRFHHFRSGTCSCGDYW